MNENLGHIHKFGDTHSLQSLRSSQERVPRGTGIQRVLITALSAMREDNEGRRMLYRQFKGDCKNQSAPWQHMKRLLSPIARGQKKWRTRPRLNHKGTKALTRLTPQSQQLHAKAGALSLERSETNKQKAEIGYLDRCT